MYEDSLNLIAKLPAIAAHIYRATYKGGNQIAANPKLDWAANLSHMMGACMRPSGSCVCLFHLRLGRAVSRENLSPVHRGAIFH